MEKDGGGILYRKFRSYLTEREKKLGEESCCYSLTSVVLLNTYWPYITNLIEYFDKFDIGDPLPEQKVVQEELTLTQRNKTLGVIVVQHQM